MYWNAVAGRKCEANASRHANSFHATEDADSRALFDFVKVKPQAQCFLLSSLASYWKTLKLYIQLQCTSHRLETEITQEYLGLVFFRFFVFWLQLIFDRSFGQN